MNQNQIYLLIFLLLGLVYMFGRLLETKEIKAHANSLNTYLDNLGFTPTRISATLLYVNKRYASMYSQATINALSLDKTQYHGPNLWLPLIGVFMDTKKKVFAIRSDKNETIPKVYSFSQLQDFEVSQDVREGMRGAVYSHGITIGFGGTLKGSLSMRVVFSGINGPESVTLQPAIVNSIQAKRININSRIYKQKLGQLTEIADCLLWIYNNA